MEFFAMPQFQTMFNDNSVYQQFANRSVNADQYLGRFFPEIGDLRLVGTELMGDANCTVPLEWTSCTSPKIDRSFSLNSTCLTEERFGVSAATENTASIIGGCNSKKRKAEVIVAEDCKAEEIGEAARQEESKDTTKSNMETSTENSKNSNIQKPDYIHVRVRRGHATDSHSLAERVRREKINKKMKCLQDLVPGCTKVTGKAGMLDEIINYVQSLQRQIEFLSMKLAALNPRLDFDVDSFFTKEFPAHITGFPAVAAPSENANWEYVQFSHSHQEAACCGIDMPISPTQQASGKTESSLVSIPKAFDSSCFPQAQSLSTWGTDLHALSNAEFH